MEPETAKPRALSRRPRAGVLAAILAVLTAGGGAGRADPPSSPSLPTVPAESPQVAVARAKDLAAYEAAKDSLARDSARSWIVIADGKVAAKGAALEDVRSAAANAAHRFVFRVGDEGDREGVLSFWRAPRIAGMSLAAALDVTYSEGYGEITLSRGEERAAFRDASPFPRIRISMSTPDGTSPAPPGGETSEVFLGTIGPDLVITPGDAMRLRLERWEVPGTLSVYGGTVPCRRVLLAVAVPGISGEATIVGGYPTVPREKMVDILRWSNQFWSWGAGGPISKMPLAGVPEGDWVVFGNDRVLGHGRTPEEAATAAEMATDFAYHRFLLQVPQEMPQAFIPVGGERDAPRVFDVRKAAVSSVVLNGRRVDARVVTADPPTYVVAAPEAATLGLEMTEAPYDARIVASDDAGAPARYARAGRAWTEVARLVDGKAAGTRKRLALVAYERPKIPGLDDPLPEWPGAAGMK